MFLFYCKIMSDADKCYINISKICSEPTTLALKLESMHKKLWEIENKLYILKFSAVKMKKKGTVREQLFNFILTTVHMKLEILRSNHLGPKNVLY